MYKQIRKKRSKNKNHQKPYKPKIPILQLFKKTKVGKATAKIKKKREGELIRQKLEREKNMCKRNNVRRFYIA